MYSLLQGLRRKGYRTYILALCVFYLILVFTFHSNLQGGSSLGRASVDSLNKSPDNNDPGSDNQDSKLAAAIGINPKFPPQDSVGRTYLDKFLKEEGRLPESSHNGSINALGLPGLGKQVVIGKENPAPELHAEPMCVGNKAETMDFFRQISGTVYVFSAYWDMRSNDFDNKQGAKLLRMMVAIQSRQRPPLQCVFEISGEVVKSPVTYYEMCENHGRVWGAFIMSCVVPSQVAAAGMPCSVKLWDNQAGKESSPIAIHTLEPQKERRRFTLCVPPLFGQLDVNRLIEFVEVSLTVGAQHIFIYNFIEQGPVLELLKYYRAMGVVSVIDWQMPPSVDQVIWYHGQSLAIQDCLYRNMAWSDYVMFNDIDEVLVPHQHNSWEEMVQAAESPDLAALQFHSAFFPPISSDHSMLLSSTTRTEMLSRIRTKCLVKPTQIFEKGIHHVSKPILAHLEVRRMDQPEFGFLHHYRNCMPNFGMSCHNMVDDDTLGKYAQMLSQNIKVARARIFNEK